MWIYIFEQMEVTVEKGNNIAHKVKDKILANVPQIIDVHIHVEPVFKLLD